MIDVHIIHSVGRNLDFSFIGSADSLRAIVRLECERSMVDVADAKNPQISGVSSSSECARIGTGINVNVEFVHSFDLKHTLRGAGTKEREIILARVQGELNSIKSSLHRAESEV